MSNSLWALQWHSMRRIVSLPSADPVRRWTTTSVFRRSGVGRIADLGSGQDGYLLMTRHFQDMLYETPGLSQKDRRRAAFWWRNALNAMAPSNFLLTNPVAMRKAVETNGEPRSGLPQFSR